MESAKQYKYTYDDMAIKSPHLHVKHVLHERPVPGEEGEKGEKKAILEETP